MKLTEIELRHVEMPLVSPFRTSFGTQTVRSLLIEQPFEDEEILAHAELAKHIRTPGLPGRVDRVRQSRRRHHPRRDLGDQHQGRPGGRLPGSPPDPRCLCGAHCSGCGPAAYWRPDSAANVALAALPGFTLPGDTSASDRYYRTDITEPFVLDDGYLPVPTGPGLGVAADRQALNEVTVSKEWIPAS